MRARVHRGIAGVIAGATFLILAGFVPAFGQTPDSAFLAGMEWRSIGPTNMSGRVTDIEGVPGTATFYVAAAAGGIWKTINNGTTFTPIFDDQPVISMGDLAVAPSDPNVLYAGTGEEDSRNSISPGAGVYVSRDGGESWTFAGLAGTQAIGRILVHPDDPNTAWVAALGHPWGTNDERGLYKTTDGGQHWDLVKFVSDRAGFVDLAMDPRNPDVLWASSWERIRGPWYFKSGGPGSALWKSTDGGETWTEVTGGGFPSTNKGRIGLAISMSQPDIMYALVEAEEGEGVADMDEDAAATSGLKGTGLYRSEDGGQTWTWMNGVDTRPFYYSQVRVAPDNPDLVFWSSTPVQFSKDGGKTVGEATIGIHVDHHAMWWDPSNPDHFIVGNDGGIAQTWDRGGTYDFLNTIPIGQFYHVSFNMDVPYRVCGGLQDNGTWCGPSRRARGAIDDHMWYTINGGDGFYTQQDPEDPAIVYSESQGGAMARVNLETGDRNGLGRPDWTDKVRSLLDSIAVYEGVDEPREMTAEESEKVDAWKQAVAGDSAKYDLRFNWNTPIVMSPHAPSTIYAGGNRVIASTDQGDNFEVISPDLSNGDTMKIRVSTRTTGGITNDATGAETYATIVALDESPLVQGRLYAGTDDGNVWVRSGPAAQWQMIPHDRFRGVPEGTYVSRVEPSNHAADRFFVTFDGHRNDDYAPYIYVTDDFGRRFRRITDGLPTGGPNFVHVVREDLVNPDLLFAGTDVGAYVSTDRGRHWTRFMTGLPTVPVHDLEIHPRDHEMIAATHGRAIWIVDIAPLQQLAGVDLDDPAVFAPAPGLQFGDGFSGGESVGNQYFEGENRDYGARISYWIPEGFELPAPAADQAPARGGMPGRMGMPGRGGPQAQITILNAAGDTVGSLNGPAGPGLHSVAWNLRARGAQQEQAKLSPSERRDSIRMAAAVVEIGDSLVEHEGADRAVVDRALQLFRTGNLAAAFRGGGGGGGAVDPQRPAERYPPEQPDWAQRTEQAAGAGQAEEAGEEAAEGGEQAGRPGARGGQQVDMAAVGDVMRQIFYAMRDRGMRMSFRGRFGGFGGGGAAEPGVYTVSVKLGDQEWTRPLRVVRGATMGSGGFGFELEDLLEMDP